jgi:hypothetical protein
LLSLALLIASIFLLLFIEKSVKNKKHIVTNIKYISEDPGLGTSASAIIV